MVKNVIKLLIILIMSMLIGNMAYGMYKEYKIGDGPNSNSTEIANHFNLINDTNTTDNTIVIEKILEEFQGYKVSARLEIPKIGLKTYILDSDDEDAMWICPTIYYGPEPNEVGNYCIAAHNYDKENMFNHIIELEKEIKFFYRIIKMEKEHMRYMTYIK